MEDKLYYIDGYLREAEAKVVTVKENGIILDRTIFYPEGGGQPGDRGTFDNYKIIDTVKDEEGNSLHIIEGDKPEIGHVGMLHLDWTHRVFYMTEHSAQHLVSSILFKHGIGTVAVHQGERFFTIETDHGEIDEEVLLAVENEANAAIRKNHEIKQCEMSHEEAEALGMRRSIKVSGRVKVVFIESLDAVACGGVHLKSTGEIGEIQYCGAEKIRGHVRTIWKCGTLSVSYRRENKAIVDSASSLLSAEPEMIIPALKKLKEDESELRRELKLSRKKIAQLEIRVHGTEVPIIFRSDVDSASFEDAFDESDERTAFIVDGDGRFMFHGTKDCFDILKEKLQLRGGGRGKLYRGSVEGDADVVLDNIRSLLNGRNGA